MDDHDMLIRVDEKIDRILSHQEKQNGKLEKYGDMLAKHEKCLTSHDTDIQAFKARMSPAKAVIATGTVLGIIMAVLKFFA